MRLKKNFATQIRGYALIKPQFVGLLQFNAAKHEDVNLESIFQVLDKDGVGRIDGLGLLAGIALCCDGSFEEKVKVRVCVSPDYFQKESNSFSM